MKLRLTTTENKCFVTLVGMFNMYCSSLFFFPSHRFVLFFLQYFCTVHTAFFTVVHLQFHFGQPFFHCCSSIVYFYFPFIYITIHPVFLHCECTIAAIVLWFREFLFFFLPFIQPFCLFNWHGSYSAQSFYFFFSF